eukprot:3523453-Rhodomonas_salina.2
MSYAICIPDIVYLIRHVSTRYHLSDTLHEYLTPPLSYTPSVPGIAYLIRYVRTSRLSHTLREYQSPISYATSVPDTAQAATHTRVRSPRMSMRRELTETAAALPHQTPAADQIRAKLPGYVQARAPGTSAACVSTAIRVGCAGLGLGG